MLTCKEVSRTIAADELPEADWKLRLAVKLHLLMCRHCRRYARQMTEIGQAARGHFSEPTHESEDRERLRASILEQIPSSKKPDSDTQV